jgi:hypothetical protein
MKLLRRKFLHLVAGAAALPAAARIANAQTNPNQAIKFRSSRSRVGDF